MPWQSSAHFGYSKKNRQYVFSKFRKLKSALLRSNLILRWEIFSRLFIYLLGHEDCKVAMHWCPCTAPRWRVWSPLLPHLFLAADSWKVGPAGHYVLMIETVRQVTLLQLAPAQKQLKEVPVLVKLEESINPRQRIPWRYILFQWRLISDLVHWWWWQLLFKICNIFRLKFYLREHHLLHKPWRYLDCQIQWHRNRLWWCARA